VMMFGTLRWAMSVEDAAINATSNMTMLAFTFGISLPCSSFSYCDSVYQLLVAASNMT